ncbi:MAG: rhamnogalacturonan acetylesterase, partial [Bacteroidales bacterium]|nr:rhamnogalacturonan acetylesterase [Bacteroidales bacterium]
MTRTLYEAFGEEASKCLFVHYPAGTWPGQTKDLADNTHFNPFGAYQVAKCVVEGLRQANVDLVQYLRDDVTTYHPAHPDDPIQFIWSPSEYIEIEKPDGN